MNFYPPPPVIAASLYVRIPEEIRCKDRESEWRGGFSRPFQNIFLEGPVYTTSGDLFVVDIPYGRILRIDADKRVNVEVEWDGEPNGLAVDLNGKIAIADYKQGILTFDRSTGKVDGRLKRKNLERFKGPNDLVFDKTGNLYFTDQGQTGMTDQTGKVYRLSPEGHLDTLVDNGISPNGLALSPDEKFLYVAMTRQNSVWRLPLHADVSNARLAGMQKDLHMTDVEWSAAISLFYVGYIISQIPANIIMAKQKPRIWMPCIMLAWSAVTICMPAAAKPWHFMLCRFLVGFTEGPFLPVVALMTSSWYTKEESPFRMAIWHAGNIVSNVFSGLLSAAILTNMDNIAGLHAWQWFLLLEGIVSIMVALPGFWLLPNFPNNTGDYYFTPEEQEMAQYRQFVSAGGVSEDEEGSYFGGFMLAIKEPFTYLFAGMHFALIIAQSFKDFFPSIVATLGFGKVKTYLVQAPPYVIAYIVTLVVSWSSGRNLEHGYHIIGAISSTLIGAVIMISTLNTGVRYFSMILLCCGPFVGLNIQLSWETTVVPRPRTKRAALIAIANCVSSVSHWFTPYFFLTNQEPRYQTGGGCIIVGCVLTILCCLATKWWCARKNKALIAEEERTGVLNSWRYAT